MVAVESDGLDQPCVAEMPELTVAWVERLIEAVAEVVRRHGAKCPDRRQRARL